MTPAFFVAADGLKITEPALTHCFRQDLSEQPSLLSQPKSVEEIMGLVLTRIDCKLKFEDRKPTLLLNNAPCCPGTLQNKLAQIKLVFLPKCTMSQLRPLDSGIIRAFKCNYRKFLVKYVVSKVDDGKRASDILTDKTILKAIHWLQASCTSCIASKNVGSKQPEAPTLTLVLMRNFKVYSSNYDAVKTLV